VARWLLNRNRDADFDLTMICKSKLHIVRHQRAMNQTAFLRISDVFACEPTRQPQRRQCVPYRSHRNHIAFTGDAFCRQLATSIALAEVFGKRVRDTFGFGTDAMVSPKRSLPCDKVDAFRWHGGPPSKFAAHHTPPEGNDASFVYVHIRSKKHPGDGMSGLPI
jgi:hypothetical protein